MVWQKQENFERLTIARMRMRIELMMTRAMIMRMVWQKQEDLEGLAITSTPFLHCGDSQPRRQNKTKCSWYYHHWLSWQDIINFHLFKGWGWIKTKAFRTKQLPRKEKTKTKNIQRPDNANDLDNMHKINMLHWTVLLRETGPRKNYFDSLQNKSCCFLCKYRPKAGVFAKTIFSGPSLPKQPAQANDR